MDELRKVTFDLNGSDVFGFQHLSLGDMEDGDVDAQEYTKRRRGFFHGWGNGIQFSNEGKPFQVTYAIVEMANGRIVKIPPQNIKFVK